MALRIVYNDANSSFKEWFTKDNSVTLHDRNLQVLVTEMFKIKKGISPEIMGDVFKPRECRYNLRNMSDFKSHCVKTVHFGTETVSYLGPKLWNILPNEFREIDDINTFKTKIKNWVPQNCPCRLCKTYIQRVGFL